MYYNYYNTTGDIYHHGILGMHWGRRNGPPYPLDASDHSSSEKKAGWRKSLGNDGKQAVQNVVVKKKKSKQHYVVQNKNKDSKYRKKIVDNFVNAGLSKKQAEKEADSRIRTRNALLVIGGIAAVSAVGLAVYRHNKSTADMLIKTGKTLQRIEMQDTNGQLHDVFYAAAGKHDKILYKGKLGTARKLGTGHAYQMDIKVNKDIRIAGDKTSKKTFKKLYDTDANFRKTIDSHYSEYRIGDNPLAIPRRANGNINKMYDSFNQDVVFNQHQTGSRVKARQQFYDELKKQGYSGFQDVNDKKYSGYKAQNPAIVFNNGKDFAVQKSKELKAVELAEAAGKTRTLELGKTAVYTSPLITGSAVAANINSDLNESSDKYKRVKYYNR